MTQNGTIVGYFPSRTSAESAITALETAGFSSSNIGLAEKWGEGKGTGAWQKIKHFFGAGSSGASDEDAYDVEPRTYGYDDVHQSLSGLSVTDEEARYFRHRFGSDSQGAIVTVTAPGREAEAERILQAQGADLGSAAASYKYDKSEMPNEEQNIRLYGEVLRVHTDRVNRGEARLRKEVHTSTQTVEVPVRREELVVERVPVQGERAAGADASFEEKEIRIPLSEERARVEKQPVVREEVRVGKKQVTDTKKFDEQVREEDLKVDDKDVKRKTA